MPLTYIKYKPKNTAKSKATAGKTPLKVVPIVKGINTANVMVRILKINRWVFTLESTETDKKLNLSLSSKKMVLLVLANNIDNNLRHTRPIKRNEIVKYAGIDGKTVKKALDSLITDEIIESIPKDGTYKINYEIQSKIKGAATNKKATPFAIRIINYNRSLFFSGELGYKIKATERLLLISLADRTGKTFRVQTPVSVITKRTGLSSATQNNAVSQLINRELLNTYSCKEDEESKKMITTTYILDTKLMKIWEKRIKNNKAKDMAYKEKYG